MASVEETRLPGIGIRFDFVTDSGVRIGVLVHRTGLRELLVYREDDADECAIAVDMAADEARTLAEMLGASQIVAQLETLNREIDGLAYDSIVVDADAEWAGLSLRDAAVHTRTGTSIVAIMCDSGTIAAPGADDTLDAGATVVAVGSTEGIRKLSERLRRG